MTFDEVSDPVAIETGGRTYRSIGAKRSAVWCLCFAVIVWCLLASLYSPAVPGALRPLVAGCLCLTAFLSVLRTGFRHYSRAAALALCAVVAFRWLLLAPSNDRDWAPEVSKTPWAAVHGDKVTVHNVRNFHYRGEHDFDPGYEDRTYDLRDLSSVDFAVSYWSSRHIAHVMTSFSFGDRAFLAFSVETRKERSEAYSTVNGFFRQYELIYIAGDERDLFAVRTNHRNPEEQVYLLRSRMPRERARKLFLQYAKEITELHRHPRFYNTLTTNCTTQILKNAQSYSPEAKYSWRILLSGHVPDLLHMSGNLQTDLPLSEILDRGLINGRSRAGENRLDYSQYIRQGVPKPAPR